jgi:hypothetical protein
MSDDDKLKKLFQACLRDTARDSVVKMEPAAAVTPLATQPTPEPPAAAEPPDALQDPAPVAANLGLDAVASEELRVLLEEQNNRKARKHKRERMMCLIVLCVLTGGGYAWFVQAPERVQALKEALSDMRSAGDVTTMVAKYRSALDRISVRSKHVNQATESIGGSSNQDGEKDPYLNAEMGALMGGDGKSVSQRDQLLQEKFGNKSANNNPNARQPDKMPGQPPAAN